MTSDRLRELAARAARGKTGFTKFLDPAQKRDAASLANAERARVAFYGGYAGAEREIACFYDSDMPGDFPISCVEARWNPKFASAEHRDILGALMALSIERDVTGDIITLTDRAYIFVTSEMAEYLRDNLLSAGRATLSCGIHIGEITPPPPEGRLIRVTVQSLRLDALVSAAYDISRAKAQDMIRAGLVKLNHLPEARCDYKAGEGDMLSVRGRGRVKIQSLQGETRRGRLAAMLFMYGK